MGVWIIVMLIGIVLAVIIMLPINEEQYDNEISVEKVIIILECMRMSVRYSSKEKEAIDYCLKMLKEKLDEEEIYMDKNRSE